MKIAQFPSLIKLVRADHAEPNPMTVQRIYDAISDCVYDLDAEQHLIAKILLADDEAMANMSVIERVNDWGSLQAPPIKKRGYDSGRPEVRDALAKSLQALHEQYAHPGPPHAAAHSANARPESTSSRDHDTGQIRDKLSEIATLGQLFEVLGAILEHTYSNAKQRAELSNKVFELAGFDELWWQVAEFSKWWHTGMPSRDESHQRSLPWGFQTLLLALGDADYLPRWRLVQAQFPDEDMSDRNAQREHFDKYPNLRDTLPGLYPFVLPSRTAEYLFNPAETVGQFGRLTVAQVARRLSYMLDSQHVARSTGRKYVEVNSIDDLDDTDALGNDEFNVPFERLRSMLEAVLSGLSDHDREAFGASVMETIPEEAWPKSLTNRGQNDITN